MPGASTAAVASYIVGNKSSLILAALPSRCSRREPQCAACELNAWRRARAVNKRHIIASRRNEAISLKNVSSRRGVNAIRLWRKRQRSVPVEREASAVYQSKPKRVIKQYLPAAKWPPPRLLTGGEAQGRGVKRINRGASRIKKATPW